MTVKITIRIAVIALTALFSVASGAQAAPLSVVDVAAPAINCVFNSTPIPNVPPPACQVVVNDSIGVFTPPGDIGVARLQSRTYPGTAPAPAAGDMAYVYRVDLTTVKGVTAANCVTKLALKFGPVVKLQYGPSGDSDIFVVTSGGLGVRQDRVRGPSRQHDYVYVRAAGLSGRHQLFLRPGVEIGESRRRQGDGVFQSRRQHEDGRSRALNRPVAFGRGSAARGKMPCAFALSLRRLFCILRLSAPRRM